MPSLPLTHRHVATLIVTVCAQMLASSQALPSPTIADAQARLNANDPAGAAKLLEVIVHRSPTDLAAWRLLGTAERLNKRVDRALHAFHTALELRPSGALMYQVGATYALKGDASAAFEWLGKAKTSRHIDMSQMDTDPNLSALRSDPRFRRLRPTAADFANPFVEPTEVLREWRGQTAGEQFGWIARGIGDVDQDDVADVAISSPTRVVAGANAGRIFVYSSGTGSLLWSADGQPGDRLGLGIESAGDVNADRVPDVVASAPGGEYAKVFSGRDGRILLTLQGENRGDAFGRQASGIGDINGDGHADVMVGAPANDAGGDGAGRAYVFSGKDGARLLTLTGERTGDGFGSSVSGRVDGKHALLVVGAARGGPAASGRVYVFQGLSDTPHVVIDADETGAALGAMFVSVPGDVDRDGVLDAFSSDFMNAAKGPATGRVYVHSGRTGQLLLALTGDTAGEGFGSSNSVAGDIDADGHADLIVGAWQHGAAAGSGGRAYLYSGKDGRVLRTFTGRIPGDTLGFDANEIGDVNGDGLTDLLITAAWSGANGFQSGRVFIVSSGVSRASP